jgi:hypothetical protein
MVSESVTALATPDRASLLKRFQSANRLLVEDWIFYSAALLGEALFEAAARFWYGE